MEQRIIATTMYNDKGYQLVFFTGFNDGFKSLKSINLGGIGIMGHSMKNDIQVVLKSPTGKMLDDAICHFGSYGDKNGEWEIMSQSIPKSEGDTVKGWLTWKEVEKYFDKTIKANEAKKK
jgi:hypothetical protein